MCVLVTAIHKCRTKVLLWHWLCVESPFSYFPQAHIKLRVENHGIPHLSKVAAWHGKGQHVGFNSNMTHTHARLVRVSEVSAVSKCPRCVQPVPNIDERCMSASGCPGVCSHDYAFRQIKAATGVFQTSAGILVRTRDIEHTQIHACSGLFRVSLRSTAYH